MKKCDVCGRFMTEFDVSFQKQLPIPRCTCYQCATKGGIEAALKWRERYQNAIHLYWSFVLPGLIFLSLIFGMVVALLIVGGANVDINEHEVLMWIFTVPMYVPFCLMIINFFRCAYKIVKSFDAFDAGDPTPTGKYHYETTISADKIETRKVEETYGGGITGATVAFLTFFIWGVPYLLYCFYCVYVSIYKKCPREVIAAKRYAEKTAKLAIVWRSDVEKIEKEKEKYEKEKKRIRETYSILGTDEVERRVAQLKAPSFTARIQRKKALIIAYDSSRSLGEIYYALFKSESGIEGKIVSNSYFVHFDNEDWKNEFEQAGFTQKEIDFAIIEAKVLF